MLSISWSNVAVSIFIIYIIIYLGIRLIRFMLKR